MSLLLTALALGCTPALASPETSESWVSNPTFRARADNRTQTPIPMYEVNLDLPQKDRWTAVANVYKDKIGRVTDYLSAFIPKWALPILEAIAGSTKTYFSDYGEEMEGLAEALDVKVGEVVMINLIYQLEHIGINCSNWNNTGPTTKDDPGCKVIDPRQEWCYCKDKKADAFISPRDVPSYIAQLPERAREAGPAGPCTSVVAEDEAGHIYHGRNLDWNLPPEILEMVIDVNFTRGGKTVFYGTSIVGFVGLIGGMMPGGFSSSQDARGKGGTLAGNILEALAHKAMTPAQHMRKAFETATDFASGVEALKTGDLIDEVYYVVGGASTGQGAVVSRDRNDAADVWSINSTSFYRLETNYDHWEPVPKADDRRTPGNTNMNALGKSGVGIPGLWNVMTTWPTFNHHTDYTGVWAPWNSTYVSYVWI